MITYALYDRIFSWHGLFRANCGIRERPAGRKAAGRRLSTAKVDPLINGLNLAIGRLENTASNVSYHPQHDSER